MIRFSPTQSPLESPFAAGYQPPRVLGLGVIGLGEGRSILSAAKESRLWSLRNLCDLDRALIEERKKEFSLACAGTTELDDLLKDPEIDVIAIYTPDRLHATHVKRSLEAGKHVICTKPLLTDLKEGRDLLEASRRSNRLVFVGQSSRFIHPMWRQKEDAKSGALGEITAVEAHYFGDHRGFYQRPWTKGGGSSEVFQGLSHPVDLVRWHLPALEEVMGYGILTKNAKDLGQIDPDGLHFVFRAAGGEVARVSGHYGQPTLPGDAEDMIQCIVRGEQGASVARFEGLDYVRRVVEGGRTRSYKENFAQWREYYWRFGGHMHHAGEFQNYIDHVARAVHEGVAPEPSLEDGLRTVATLVAMDRSVKSGGPQKVSAVLSEFGLGELILNAG